MDNGIKKILIPTDFGELGSFAYDLGKYIAKQTGASIDVMSIVPGPRGAFYSPTGALMNDEGNDYSEWTTKLTDIKNKMKQWVTDKEFVSDTFCTIGDIDEQIIRYATDHDMDLIVMGTEGMYTSKVWSNPSHAEYISNHSPIPVLSLKCDRSDIHLNEILFVGDFTSVGKIDLDIVKSLQSVFDSKLLLLHIRLDDEVKSNDQIEPEMKSFAIANDLSNYEIHIYASDTVESGIGKFAAEHDIDLITLGTHQKSGFSKLFKGSVSDDVVNHLFHPVLTFAIQS